MKVCSYCGRENGENAAFCTGCGMREFASAPATPTAPKAPKAPKAPTKPSLMSPDTATTVLQVLGTLAALSSLRFLVRGYGYAVAGEWLEVAVMAGFGSYFVYVGYLSRMRFSPRAIQHTCGATLYLAFCACQGVIRRMLDDKAVQGVCTLFLLFAIVWGYRKAWRYFVALLFDETDKHPLG